MGTGGLAMHCASFGEVRGRGYQHNLFRSLMSIVLDRLDAHLDPCCQASAHKALRQRPQPRDYVCAARVQDDQVHITCGQVKACRQNILEQLYFSDARQAHRRMCAWGGGTVADMV